MQRSTSRHRRTRARNAFTLMEVVVAVIIVGMTSVATLSAFAAELRTAETSRSALEAASLAENRLAIAEVIPSEDLLSLPDTSKSGIFEPPFEHYGWTTAVKPVVNEKDLFDVTVTVTGTNGRYAIGTRIYRPVAPVRVP